MAISTSHKKKNKGKWSGEGVFHRVEWDIHKSRLECVSIRVYDALIGIEYLEKLKAKVDYYEKYPECID